MSAFKGEYPKNLNVQGVLSFPITSDEDIAKLKEWRTKKGIKPPKFADKIGGALFLTEKMLDKVVEHLENTYLPFVDTLFKETDGEKGVEPAKVKELIGLVKKRDWSTKQLPVRELTAKDIENRPDEKYIVKLKFQGPYQSDIQKKAIAMNSDGSSYVTTIDTLVDDEVIPENWSDLERLWWGAGASFRTNLRFNTFDTASLGVTGYAQTIYLLPHLGLPQGSGGGDAAVVDEGDDWSDEE